MSEPTGGPNLYQEYEQRLAQEREQACETLKVYFDRFHELNINRVIIRYDGGSDSGVVESVTAFDASNQKVQLSKALEAELTQLAQTLLQFGWEIDDSVFGRYIFDVPQRELVREHNWREVVTEFETETWQL